MKNPETYTCDRCGKKFERSTNNIIGYDIIKDYQPGRYHNDGPECHYVDLCIECRESFWKWIHMGNPPKTMYELNGGILFNKEEYK